MPSRQTGVLFMISAFGLNLTPGPAILFILSCCLGQGQGCGRRFGIWACHRIGDPGGRGGIRPQRCSLIRRVVGERLLAWLVGRPLQPQAPSVLPLVSAAIRRSGEQPARAVVADPRLVVSGHRGTDQLGHRPCRRIACRTDWAAPVLGPYSAILLSHAADWARCPAGVERAPLTGNPTFFRGGAARAAFSGTDQL